MYNLFLSGPWIGVGVRTDAMSVDDVAEFYGISKESLALYEREGIVSPFRVGDSRYYTRKDRARIEIVLKGKKLGFSVNEVKRLIMAHIPAPPPRERSQIEAQIARLEEQKAELQAVIDELEESIKRDS